MTDERKTSNRNRNRKKFNPKNKEHASRKPKKRWKKKKQHKPMKQRLKELQDYYNDNFHTE